MRDSCIVHAPRQPMAIVRQDYYELMGKDCVAAAIMNVFEYWAYGAIAANPTEQSPWLGIKTIKNFEEMLVGISTDKQIRTRLKTIEEMGFIEVRQPLSFRKSLEYRFLVDKVQEALDRINGQTTVSFQKPNGQTTVGNQQINGQTTVEPTVKQPFLYIQERSKESFLKEEKRADTQTPDRIIEPEQPRQPASLLINEESAGDRNTSREGGSSAAPAEISKNWRSHYERFHRPPWRLEDGSFHPLIIKALHETGGSPGKPNIHDRPDGRMNEAKLAKMLRRLDTSALGSGYRAACSSTQELSDYWNRAVEMHEEQQAASERVATVPVPHIDLIAPPTEEEKQISSEGAAIARRLMMGGRA